MRRGLKLYIIALFNVNHLNIVKWLQQLMVELEGYNNNLKNRLFGLLCEREKEGEWEKFLDSIVIELMS